MSSSLHFCDREQELQQLIDCWHSASDPASPEPHLVVIKGERGLGKTRLALEFYRWLSSNQDLQSHESYWPNALSIFGRNLEVNPNPQLCNFASPIPYLWWGVRCADQESENSVAGDAIASHDRLIAPHLVTLSMRSMMESRAISITKAWLSVGVDAAASALQVDTVLSVGKAISESIKIIKEGLDETGPAHARSAFSKHALSRSDALLVDLEKVFNPALRSYARTPGVIFVDDAQFCAEDPALPSFLERLLTLAGTQKWPVMILATHWRREFTAWSGEPARSSQYSLPQIITRAASSDADLVLREIDLTVVADLGPALRQRFLGLTHHQQRQILERAGGNPRFLEQMMALMSETEDYFVDIDTAEPLTEEGLEEILRATPDIFATVMKRMRAAPEEVQQALGLASAQGMRFLPRMVTEMGVSLLGHQLADHLAAAEDPYSMVVNARSDSRVGTFSERLVQEVATKRRRSLASIGGEQKICSALRERLCMLIDNPNTEQDYSDDERLVAYRLALREFGTARNKPDKRRFEEASVRLIALERSRGSHEAALTFETQLYMVASVPASDAFMRCWQAAGSHVNASARDENLIWIKTDLSPPLLEHLSFRIKNQIYLVRVIDIDGKVNSQGTTAGLIHHAQQWSGVPCLLPMRLGNGEWEPANPGWGLIHAQDKTPVHPPELASDTPVEMTDWELYDFAVMCVRRYIEDTLGKRVASYCNNPLINPSIFFEDEEGLEWIVVRVERDEKGGQRPRDAMLTQAMLRDNGYPAGHFASIGVVSPDGPDQPLIRGTGLRVHFKKLEPFWDGQPMLVTEGTRWRKVDTTQADGEAPLPSFEED